MHDSYNNDLAEGNSIKNIEWEGFSEASPHIIVNERVKSGVDLYEAQ